MAKQYGIIGCGMMGIEHINNLNLLNGAQVSAVYDPVPELAAAASQRAGGAIISPSLKALVSLPELDAVVVVSPNYLHVDNLEEISAHCNLPILCEKPLYTSPAQEAKLQRIVNAHKAPIWVAMEYRYMPPIAQMAAQANNVTGGVKMLTIKEHRIPFLPKIGDWNRFNQNTGGTLVEKCCHFFDLMRFITNAEPIRVSASAGQIVNHLDEVYDGKVPDIWDGGYVIFDFDNGARAMLELCMFADGTLWNEEISAVGPKGKIECRMPGPHRFWPNDIGPPPESQITLAPRSPKRPVTTDVLIDHDLLMAGDHHGSTFFQHEKFLKVVQGNGQVEVTVDDGRKAVKMGLAAQKAASEHRVIEL
ncbi:MAG: Gfo/Idh/MocA family oxidoreductase [Litorimonas sp.]